MLRSLVFGLLAVATAFAGVESGFAENLWVPARASKIRIARSDGRSSMVGVPVAFSDSSLTLSGNTGVNWSWNPNDRLEVSRGGSRKSTGALIGLASGALVGALIGAGTAESNSSDDLSPSPAASVGIGAAAFGLAGAILGRSLAAEDSKWEPLGWNQVRVDAHGLPWIPAGSDRDLRVTRSLQVGSRIVGTFRSFDRDTLVLNQNGSSLAIPVGEVRRLDVVTSRRGRGFLGMVLGAGAGFGIGAASIHGGSQGSDLGGAILTGVAGALVGRFLGAAVTVPVWEEIPIRPTSLKPVIQNAAESDALAEPPVSSEAPGLSE